MLGKRFLSLFFFTRFILHSYTSRLLTPLSSCWNFSERGKLYAFGLLATYFTHFSLRTWGNLVTLPLRILLINRRYREDPIPSIDFLNTLFIHPDWLKGEIGWQRHLKWAELIGAGDPQCIMHYRQWSAITNHLRAGNRLSSLEYLIKRCFEENKHTLNGFTIIQSFSPSSECIATRRAKNAVAFLL